MQKISTFPAIFSKNYMLQMEEVYIYFFYVEIKYKVLYFEPHKLRTSFMREYRASSACLCTLFSECFAHENHPNFLKSLGHRPRPRVILTLSNGLESNLEKTPCQNLNRKEFLNGVFFILLPRPFDKFDMTQGRSQ